MSSCKLRWEMVHHALANCLEGQAYLGDLRMLFMGFSPWVANLFKIHHSLFQLTSSRLPWKRFPSTLRWIIKKCKTLRIRGGAKARKESPCRSQENCVLSPLTCTLSSCAFSLLTLSICQQVLVILLRCPVVYTELGLFYRVLLMDWINGNAI